MNKSTVLVLLLLTAGYAYGQAAPKAKPTTIRTPAGVSHGIAVSWSETTAGTSFNVYRGVGTGTEVAYAQVGIGILTFNDLTGTGGTNYCYMITAVLNGIESGDSPEACAVFPLVPASPTGTTATRF